MLSRIPKGTVRVSHLPCREGELLFQSHVTLTEDPAGKRALNLPAFPKALSRRPIQPPCKRQRRQETRASGRCKVASNAQIGAPPAVRAKAFTGRLVHWLRIASSELFAGVWTLKRLQPHPSKLARRRGAGWRGGGKHAVCGKP